MLLSLQQIWRKLIAGNWVIFTKRELWIVAILIALLLATLFYLLLRFIEPPPPKVIRITTGSESGAYYQFGKKYAEKFKEHGIRLEVLPSSGAAENLKRLEQSGKRSERIDFALIQSGVAAPDQHPELESLASVAFEPVWVLSRPGSPIKAISDLKGKTIAVGVEGSGTKIVAQEILKANGIDSTNASFASLPNDQAYQQLEAGKVDAMFVVASANAPLVRRALEASMQFINFDQGDAYVRRYPWLAKVVLPKGSIDLAKRVPAEPIELIATNANLVARKDTHRAIAFLMMDIASEIHAPGGLVHNLRQFPNETGLEFEQSEESKRFFKTGRPFLQRYLPFWLANLIERLLVSIVPALAIGIPLVKIIPAFLEYRERAKILQIYEDVFQLEYNPASAKLTAEEKKTRIQTLLNEVGQLRLGAAHHPNLYSLKQHLNDSLRSIQ